MWSPCEQDNNITHSNSMAMYVVSPYSFWFLKQLLIATNSFSYVAEL